MNKVTAIFSPSHTEDHTVLRLEMPPELTTSVEAATQAAKIRAREMQMHFIRLERTEI